MAILSLISVHSRFNGFVLNTWLQNEEFVELRLIMCAVSQRLHGISFPVKMYLEFKSNCP